MGTRTHASRTTAQRATRSLAGGRAGPTPASRPQRSGVVGSCAVVEPEIAGFLGELVQDSSTLRAAAVLEVDEVLETYSAVAVRLLEGDGAVFEQLDEGGAADPEEIGRLLGSEEQALGRDKGGLPLTHDVDYLAQDAVYLGRQRDLLAVRAEKQAWLGVALEETGELEEVSRRVDNPVLLSGLPDLDIDPASVVANVDAGRAER